MTLIIISFVLLGIITGLLSGLLGVGGGLITMPALLFAFPFLPIDPAFLFLVANATSLAIIIMTAANLVYNHYRRGNLLWSPIRQLLPSILIGVFTGAALADSLPSKALRLAFAVFVLLIGIRMLFLVKPKPERGMPSFIVRNLVGFLIGAKSGAFGVGGGALSTPFLLRCNFPIHRAIACSAVFSLSIAVCASLTYFFLAMSHQVHLPYCIGYVYWPALLGVASTSGIFSPLGAKIASHLPPPLLKRLFGVFLLIVAADLFLGTH